MLTTLIVIAILLVIGATAMGLTGGGLGPWPPRANLPSGRRLQQGEPVRLGVIGPFTGPSAACGLSMLQGIQLAVDRINSAGGYRGRSIELLVLDDQEHRNGGLRQAKALVADKVVAVLGFCHTEKAMQSLDVFQQHQVPLMVTFATGMQVTRKFPAADSYIFRVAASDEVQVPFIVQEVVRRGWRRVAVFADSSGCGRSGLRAVEEALAKFGLAPVHVARFLPTVKSLGRELAAAREHGADVVVSCTGGLASAVMARGRKDMGWEVPLVGAVPLALPSFISGAGPAAEGALMAQTFIAEADNAQRAYFLAAFERKFGHGHIDVPMAAAQGYDAAHLLVNAMRGIRDGQLHGPALKQSLENLSRPHYGVVATYGRPFSATGKEAITAEMLVLGQVADGTVWPARDEGLPGHRPRAGGRGAGDSLWLL